jgi:thiol-disulfide isomerase/thioredoxin
LAQCPTPKCLTAYVAPWCPHCREAAPYIRGLQGYLKKHNVSLRVVVGQDNPDNLLAYARYFGPDTLIDEEGVIQTNGVPEFFVTDNHGNLLKRQAGFPGGYHGGLIQLASMYDLP